MCFVVFSADACGVFHSVGNDLTLAVDVKRCICIVFIIAAADTLLAGEGNALRHDKVDCLSLSYIDIVLNSRVLGNDIGAAQKTFAVGAVLDNVFGDNGIIADSFGRLGQSVVFPFVGSIAYSICCACCQ